MKILFIGDIVGKPGREVIEKLLVNIINEKGIEFVIANGENSAGGLGITPVVLNELIDNGVDIITSGNHIWRRKEVFEVIERPELLRPANYPIEVPGHGYNISKMNNTSVCVISLQGRIFMEPIDCPFSVIDKILAKVKNANIIIVDFHAEATSEKIALGWYLDGKVSAVIGTHTHVQTSDYRILPQGTAYISDAGMTGSRNGVIGVEREEIIKHFITRLPFGYKSSKGDSCLEGIIMDIDEKTGISRDVKAIRLEVKDG